MKEIGTDFQGWPIYAMTLKDILEDLGLTVDIDGTVSGQLSKELLKSYAKTLQDDGMAYGIEPRYITEVDKEVYYDEDFGENVFNMFREPFTGDTESN